MSVLESFDGWQEQDGGLVAVFTKTASEFKLRFTDSSEKAIGKLTANMEDLLDRQDAWPPSYTQKDKNLVQLAIKQFPGLLC